MSRWTYGWAFSGMFIILMGAGCSTSAAAVSVKPAAIRPPSVPLVACDPYFSVWSGADRLTDRATTHWTGKRQAMTGLVRVDGKAYRVMGDEPKTVEPMEQATLTVWPTRTVYEFANTETKVTLTFMTPALPEDLDMLSRPVTYVIWEVVSADGKEHDVALYLSASSELAVNEPGQKVIWSQGAVGPMSVMRIGSQDQPVLQKRGDDLRIDWGYAIVGVSKEGNLTTIGSQEACAAEFAASGKLPEGDKRMPRAVSDQTPTMATAMPLGKVGTRPMRRRAMLAYDDEYSINYMGQKLRPYWARKGMKFDDMLTAAWRQFDAMEKRCIAFDTELTADMTRIGGANYASICALAYRQCHAANKLCADAAGSPMLFPKENFSNGCIGTVDIIYPMAPQYLLLNPTLVKASIAPVLVYAASERWKFPFAPHDLGQYPHATGQVYGGGERTEENQMPVEESGNMLLLAAAVAKLDGNVEFLLPFWPQLNEWAEYLKDKGFDPENQLCTDDFAGHLAHNVNLSGKAIEALGAWSMLCQMKGDTAKAKEYRKLAEEFTARWIQEADDGDHYRLTFDQPGKWSQKYNLIWDRVLGLNLFPKEVFAKEIAYYRTKLNRFGLPLDSRKAYTKLDWTIWSASMATDQTDFETLVDPIVAFLSQVPQRNPMTDWYGTDDGKQVGFQARSVVGGVFMKALTDETLWKKWAGRDKSRVTRWAPFPPQPIIKEIVATSRDKAASWKFSLDNPGERWFEIGFDDRHWKQGPAPFAAPNTPGIRVGTEWKTADIWLRRTFEWPQKVVGEPKLLVYHDEDAEIYLNGILAAKVGGFSTAYVSAGISSEAMKGLEPGENVMAVHCHQTGGGQGIDAGIATETPGTTAKLPADLKPLFDYPVRDTSVRLGPDGMYYLTGTTGYPTWWKTNEGIRMWKSRDLKNWQEMGLVWSIDKDGTWQKEVKDGNRAIWAPEIHYIQKNWYLSYCINWPGGGTGILKSASGRPEGPYVDIKADGPLTPEIDASLFEDTDGTVYFVYQNGKIARMKNDLSGLAEEPRLLVPSNATQVGFEAAAIFKIDGRYHLICADFVGRPGMYHCMSASADSIYGPFGPRYLAIPHGGHNILFQDKGGNLWSTFFGNDPGAPFRERPAILKIEVDGNGKIHPLS